LREKERGGARSREKKQGEYQAHTKMMKVDDVKQGKKREEEV